MDREGPLRRLKDQALDGKLTGALKRTTGLEPATFGGVLRGLCHADRLFKYHAPKRFDFAVDLEVGGLLEAD